MSTHIDKNSAKRVNREINLGKFALIGVLVIGGWCFGDGVGHLIHPIHSSQRVASIKHTNHHQQQKSIKTSHIVTMPSNLQGSYISYLPLRTQSLSPYFQVASLVHVKPHAIYQKIFVVWKHQPKQLKSSIMGHIPKRHRKFIRTKHKVAMPKSSPYILNGKRLFYHSALPYLNDNFSSCVEPTHLTKSITGYSFITHTKSINGYYTSQHVQQFFGREKPYWFGPEDHSFVKLLKKSRGHWICNGLLYHKVSTRRAKQLLHRAPATNATFMDY